MGRGRAAPRQPSRPRLVAQQRDEQALRLQAHQRTAGEHRDCPRGRRRARPRQLAAVRSRAQPGQHHGPQIIQPQLRGD